jgi:hypothetical protein
MQCAKCGAPINHNDEREFHGQTICEDCYMVALSPAKACDPWAVYTAKSFADQSGPETNITETQSRILQILRETGGIEPEMLSARIQIKPSDLEKEIATLRHMEKLRAELRDGKKIFCLW